jgi:uncharacterized Zn-finger protein
VIEIPEGDEYSLEISGDVDDVNQFYFLDADGEWLEAGERRVMRGANVKIMGIPQCTGHTLSFAEDFTGQLLTADGQVDTSFDLYCGDGSDELLTEMGVVPSAGDSYPCVHTFSFYADLGDLSHENCYAEGGGDIYYCGKTYVLNGNTTIERIVCKRPYFDGTEWVWLPLDEIEKKDGEQATSTCPYCGGKFHHDEGEVIDTSCPYCGEDFTIDAGGVVT